MSEYYVFPTEAEAQACLDFINSTPWFPVKGMVNGQPTPEENQKTTSWADEVLEMVSGEWVVPRIPDDRLDAVGVPQEDRDAFMAAFGQDIRALTSADFPAPPEEE